MNPRDRCIGINILFSVLLGDPEIVFINDSDAEISDAVAAGLRKIERNLIRVVRQQLGVSVSE